jgi:predicted dinucleotide-binding enzyme
MSSIALFGAGGKMGWRLARNLRGSRYDVRHVEVNEVSEARLKSDFGIKCLSAEEAVDDAEAVILAVPGTASARWRVHIRPSQTRHHGYGSTHGRSPGLKRMTSSISSRILPSADL